VAWRAAGLTNEQILLLKGGVTPKGKKPGRPKKEAATEVQSRVTPAPTANSAAPNRADEPVRPVSTVEDAEIVDAKPDLKADEPTSGSLPKDFTAELDKLMGVT
jgi:hypothetical protein